MPNHSQSNIPSLQLKEMPRSISTRSPTAAELSAWPILKDGLASLTEVCQCHRVPALHHVTFGIGCDSSQTFSCGFELIPAHHWDDVVDKLLPSSKFDCLPLALQRHSALRWSTDVWAARLLLEVPMAHRLHKYWWKTSFLAGFRVMASENMTSWLIVHLNSIPFATSCCFWKILPV